MPTRNNSQVQRSDIWNPFSKEWKELLHRAPAKSTFVLEFGEGHAILWPGIVISEGLPDRTQIASNL